jgi:hypothetical protein
MFRVNKLPPSMAITSGFLRAQSLFSTALLKRAGKSSGKSYKSNEMSE